MNKVGNQGNKNEISDAKKKCLMIWEYFCNEWSVRKDLESV